MQQERKVVARELYYEVAQREIDRTNAYFDQIDNKLNITLAMLIVLPIAILGFSLQGTENLRPGTSILWAVGLIPLSKAMYHIIQAVRIRDVALGIPLQEFKAQCEAHDNEYVKLWTADMLLQTSEELYEKGAIKAAHLKKLLIPAVTFLVFLVVGTIYGFN